MAVSGVDLLLICRLGHYDDVANILQHQAVVVVIGSSLR